MLWALLLASLCGLINAESKLIMVQSVFRHGARAPIGTLSSKESEKYFYRGVGHLSDAGITQANYLGELLQERYVNTSFLDSRLIPREVAFRSSPVERCLMTASLAGTRMFNGVPPPIQTRPIKDEYTLYPKFVCKDVWQDLKEIFKLTGDNIKVTTFEEAAMKAEAKKAKYLKTTNIKELRSFIIEKEVGLAVPSWFNDTAVEEAKKVVFHGQSASVGAGRYQNTGRTQSVGGNLLYQILTNINNTVECIENGDDHCIQQQPKFYAFSTHDIMLLALLESLGMREAALGKEQLPEYCSVVLFELWFEDDTPFVKVVFRKDTMSPYFKTLTSSVRNCPKKELCPYKKFMNCCNDYVLAHPEKACANGAKINATDATSSAVGQ